MVWVSAPTGDSPDWIDDEHLFRHQLPPALVVHNPREIHTANGIFREEPLPHGRGSEAVWGMQPYGMRLCLLQITARSAGLHICGVGAHINATFPLALERIVHVDRHPADLLDLYLAEFAILQRSKSLVIRAARDHVA